MTRSEREQHIERYLSGQMNPAEEQDFFIQAALDRELRYELKALMTVDSAIRKERDAEPGEHTALRARVAAMLAAAPAPEQPAAASVPRTPAPTTGPTAGSAIQKFLPMQWLTFAAATIALTAVIFLIAERPATQNPVPDRGEQPAIYEQTGKAPALRGDEDGDVKAPAALDTKPGASIQGPENQKPAANAPARDDAPATRVAPDVRTPSAPSPRQEAKQVEAPSLKEKTSTATDASGSAMTSTKNSEGSSQRTSMDQSEEESDDDPTLAPRKRKGDSLSVGVKIKLKTP